MHIWRVSVASAIAALSLAAAPVPSSARAGAQQPPPPIVGGYREAGVRDKDVLAAGRFAVSALAGRRATLRSVDTAQQQVVQGTNYRLDLTASDGRRWRVTVYRPLRGKMRLVERQALPRQPR